MNIMIILIITEKPFTCSIEPPRIKDEVYSYFIDFFKNKFGEDFKSQWKK